MLSASIPPVVCEFDGGLQRPLTVQGRSLLGGRRRHDLVLCNDSLDACTAYT
jgi:hypothetical protein